MSEIIESNQSKPSSKFRRFLGFIGNNKGEVNERKAPRSREIKISLGPVGCIALLACMGPSIGDYSDNAARESVTARVCVGDADPSELVTTEMMTCLEKGVIGGDPITDEPFLNEGAKVSEIIEFQEEKENDSSEVLALIGLGVVCAVGYWVGDRFSYTSRTYKH